MEIVEYTIRLALVHRHMSCLAEREGGGKTKNDNLINGYRISYMIDELDEMQLKRGLSKIGHLAVFSSHGAC